MRFILYFRLQTKFVQTMRKIVFTLVLCSAGGIAFCQTVTPTVLASDGGYATSAQGSVAWTIGEPVVETYAGSSNITTMGFQQPVVDLTTLISEQDKNSAILVYPNPVKDELSISFAGLREGTYQLELHDALGKLIYQGNADISGTSVHYIIKMGEVAAGAYFLNVSAKDFTKTVKINKIN